MLLTIISKILGFGREVLLSYFYGASQISDAYITSLTIPLVIFSFIGTSVATGYIPMYNKIQKINGEEESKKFTKNLLTFLILFCFVIIIIVELFTKQVVFLFANGFDSETMNIAIIFTRITVISIYFNVSICIFNAYLQMKNKFVIPAILGFCYNVFVIIFIFLSAKINILFLPLGSAISYIIQYLFLVHYSKKSSLKYRYELNINNKFLKELIIISIPLIVGTSIAQINVLIDKTIASTISVGGISALSYADKMNSFMLSTIVMSISVTIYPKISKLASHTDDATSVRKINEILNSSLAYVSIFIIPASMALSIFSKEIVTLLFSRGAFNNNALNMTSAALLFYSAGMIFIGIREIISKTFYAFQDTRTPVYNAIVGMIINIIFNILFSRTIGIGGLALASSLSALITSVLLLYSLYQKYNIKIKYNSLIKILISSIIMVIISKIIYNLLSFRVYSLLLRLIIIGINGIILYILFLKVMKIEEFESLCRLIIKRIIK